MKRKKRILVAPLDWGLGHATRCIPIIRELLNNEAEVLLASSGNALALLKNEFPVLAAFEIVGYDPVYPANDSMVKEMMQQLPKFIKAIAQEHEEVEAIVKSHSVDAVISDNRYGCFSKKIKSVFITHQLNILMPADWKWMQRGVNYYNHKQIKEYSECWVPAADASLLGPLVTEVKGVKTRYIGNLSRLEKKSALKKYDVLVICSGPEPQRRIFESLSKGQLCNSSLKSLIVRGEPREENKTESVNAMIVKGFLNSREINNVIAESDVIISRSGYSTVMDLAKMEKKAIFIPTSGQTEQEYLAEVLMKRQVAFCMNQSAFDLQKALEETNKFSGFTKFEHDDSLLKNAVQSIL